jgi:hypothetical protein
MIKIILIGTLLTILGYALAQRKNIPALSIAMTMICLVGVFFVFLPDMATEVARVLGVGRGADLVLYFFIVLTLAIALNLHLKIRSAQETATELARAIAILDSKTPSK